MYIDFKLVMERGKEMYRYTFKGPELRPVREEIFYNDVPVLRKTISKYISYDGVEFPGELTIEQGGNIYSVRFSKCIINSGLTDNDLSFVIPSSTERLVIE